MSRSSRHHCPRCRTSSGARHDQSREPVTTVSRTSRARRGRAGPVRDPTGLLTPARDHRRTVAQPSFRQLAATYSGTASAPGRRLPSLALTATSAPACTSPAGTDRNSRCPQRLTAARVIARAGRPSWRLIMTRPHDRSKGPSLRSRLTMALRATLDSESCRAVIGHRSERRLALRIPSGLVLAAEQHWLPRRVLMM